MRAEALRKGVLPIVLSVLCGFTAAADAKREYDVIAYVRSLEGNSALASNVTHVLTLQLWRTLRLPPDLRTAPKEEAEAAIDGGPATGGKDAIGSIESNARKIGAQVTFWGYAQGFGDGVVAQTYLLAHDNGEGRKRRPEFWRLNLAGAEIVADLPRRLFEFTPHVLKTDIVKQYASESGLLICAERVLPCRDQPIGRVGFRADMHYDGSWSHIRTDDGRKGWLHLPQISRAPSEAVNFTGAVIAVYRGDWEWADRYLRQVVAAKSLRSPVRLDALLLRAMVAERAGKSGRADVAAALELNPTSRAAIQYRVMVDISEALRTGKPNRKTLESTAQFLKERRHLFLEGDPWLRSVAKAFRALDLAGF